MAALITSADLTGGAVGAITQYYSSDPNYLTSVANRASRNIETRCNRRLAPFTVTESHLATGVDINGLGAADASMPLSMAGTLGLDRARAYGAFAGLVRDVWLDQWAPQYPELWSYSNISVTLTRTLDDTQQIVGSNITGPDPDSGHMRFSLGTFCPPGSLIKVTYSGGYQTTPDDLVEACRLQALQFLIVEIEPQNRPGMDTADLEAQILGLIGDYARS